MSNEFFAGFRPPPPPPGLREKVLRTARTPTARAPLPPLLGRMELVLAAAALVLALGHVAVTAASAPSPPAAPPSRRVATLTGDPALDPLLVAEAVRWEEAQQRRLLAELGL